MTARNPVAYRLGQRKRASIKAILAAHSPLLKPLTLEELQSRLRTEYKLYAAITTIAYHRRHIQTEEELAELCCKSCNSSPPQSAA